MRCISEYKILQQYCDEANICWSVKIKTININPKNFRAEILHVVSTCMHLTESLDMKLGLPTKIMFSLAGQSAFSITKQKHNNGCISHFVNVLLLKIGCTTQSYGCPSFNIVMWLVD